MEEKKEEPKRQECSCRNLNHITESTKMEGTMYTKGWCTKCKSWVYSEKVFCVCCFAKVNHKKHYVRCKRIYNKAMKEHDDLISLYRKGKIPKDMFAEVYFNNSYYHIPLSAITRYADNGYSKDTMDELQSAIKHVKKPLSI